MHRCTKHQSILNHNLNADGGSEECGACIMREVYVLFQTQLDLLDTLADLLQSHAQIRTGLAAALRRLEYDEPAVIQREKES